ncbi:MAG: hypothetical protein GY774_08695 [Planctomycetes bacterium]|nr:hypothetical protein [Planctomycetota bacterium]
MIVKMTLMPVSAKIASLLVALYFVGIFVLPVIFLNTGGAFSLFFKDVHESLYFYVYGTSFYSAYSKWLCGVSINCIF